jgi:hypothetical protein
MGGSASASMRSFPCSSFCPAIEHWNGTAWTPVAAPDLGTPGLTLSAVTAISPRNVWAVGSTVVFPAIPVAVHWNGAAWSNVSLPVLSASRRGYLGCACGGSFSAVSGTSASDVWAVGEWRAKTLIEHWDGHAWTRVPSPTAPSTVDVGSYLLGVTAISTTNAWAVGGYKYCVSGRYCAAGLSAGLAPLILHWNGKQWRYVAAAVLNEREPLLAVDAVSAHSVWAVGYDTNTPGSASVIARWNGVRWSARVSRPRQAISGLYGVTALSATEAWAVGEQRPTDSGGTAIGPTKPLVKHWNGRSWSSVPAPGVLPSPSLYSYQSLTAAVAISATNVWAVGGDEDYSDLNHRVVATLIEHWNGHSWTHVAVQDPTPVGSLNGVAALSAHDVWAVGSY